MKKIHVGTLIIALLFPLLVGMISAALTSKSMAIYGNMTKPPLAPPAWVFPVAWTILYLMMGLSSYYLFLAPIDKEWRTKVLTMYVIQLVMNFLWSIIFFSLGLYLFAFIWLLVMWCIVIILTFNAFFIDKTAARLLVPYILWLTFAAYLNLGAYIIKVMEK